MANQGCVVEGADTRLFGWAICWLQRRFSYASEKPPRWVIRRTRQFTYWDGMKDFVSFGLAWPPYFVWQKALRDGRILAWEVTPETPDGLRWFPGEVWMTRLGWRYDVAAKIYIFPALAHKTRQPFPMETGY